MKVKATIGSNGQIKREVDFQGASLPDGRSIECILNENENFKRQVEDLKEELKESSSILTIIHNRIIRIIIEILMMLFTIIGIIIVFL